MPAMYCAPPTKIIQVRFGNAPDGTTKIGMAMLKNGERIMFSLEKASGNDGFILKLDVKHSVQVCYGPDGSKPLDGVLLGDLTAGTTAFGIIPASSTRLP